MDIERKEIKEISRVLSNPSNVILSDELHDLLEDDVVTGELNKTHSNTDDAMLFFDKETFACKIKKISRRVDAEKSHSVFVFSLFVPNMPIDVLLDESMCVLEVSDYKFCQLDHSTIKWKNNHLTIEARRILK